MASSATTLLVRPFPWATSSGGSGSEIALGLLQIPKTLQVGSRGGAGGLAADEGGMMADHFVFDERVLYKLSE